MSMLLDAEMAKTIQVFLMDGHRAYRMNQTICVDSLFDINTCTQNCITKIDSQGSCMPPTCNFIRLSDFIVGLLI